jgi:hypothetical protein
MVTGYDYYDAYGDDNVRDYYGNSNQSPNSESSGFFSWDDEWKRSGNLLQKMVGSVFSIPDTIAHLPVDLVATVFDTKEGGVGSQISKSAGKLVDTTLTAVAVNAVPPLLAPAIFPIVDALGIGDKVSGALKTSFDAAGSASSVMGGQSIPDYSNNSSIGLYIDDLVMAKTPALIRGLSETVGLIEPIVKTSDNGKKVRNSSGYVPSYLRSSSFYSMRENEKKSKGQSVRKAVVY